MTQVFLIVELIHVDYQVKLISMFSARLQFKFLKFVSIVFIILLSMQINQKHNTTQHQQYHTVIIQSTVEPRNCGRQVSSVIARFQLLSNINVRNNKPNWAMM